MTVAAASPQRLPADRLRALTQADQVRLASIPIQQINAALPVADPTIAYDCTQDRTGEEQRGISHEHALRAIYTSPWFWKSCARLPRNDLSIPTPGRPKDYPDWFLFLLEQVAAITRTASRHSAYVAFTDPARWADFVFEVDGYVPTGMTRLSQIDHTGKKARIRPPLAVARTEWNGMVTPLRRRERRTLRAALKVRPPLPHHSDYFARLWRGIDSQGNPLPDGHPWQHVRRDVMDTFRVGAIQQIQAMGGLDPTKDFQYDHADRNQSVGFDGVVFPISRKKHGSALGEYIVGGDSNRRVRGTKFTVGSTRISGQYMSRVIFDLAHTGTDPDSRAKDEQEAVRTITPIIGQLTERAIDGKTKRGLKTILVDSAVRGQDVTHLQRLGYVVVNYPHAQSNPDGGPGKRLNATRVEKNHLRTVAIHDDEHGDPCAHTIYALGGELIQLLDDYTGRPHVTPLKVLGYKQRTNKDGTFRDYLRCEIVCNATGTTITRLIPLFHTDATSTDPDYNWGEVCRVFPPTSAAFQYLYGQRNDTEARHTDLKARAKYLPVDVPGQELRLLSAAMLSNALAWQVHCQAHQQPNVFDDTA